MNDLVYNLYLLNVVSSVEGFDAVAVKSASDNVEVGSWTVDNLVVKLWVS